jgi:Core-2/I-Branching enzyme
MGKGKKRKKKQLTKYFFTLFLEQWAVLIRKHAEVVVNDGAVFPQFQKHCRVASITFFHFFIFFSATICSFKLIS